MLRLYFFFLLMFLISCTQDGIPREKAYQRLTLPKKSYKKYTSECNYSFDIPQYSHIEKKEFFRNEMLTSDSCWVNIQFPELGGTIHMSYKYYENSDQLNHLLEDAYRLTSKHMTKASYIKDSVIDRDDVKGLIYSVGGNSASEKQFILTDYKHKFIRGAMYFNTTPNYDSMRPVLEFVDKDIARLISSFKFQ